MDTGPMKERLAHLLSQQRLAVVASGAGEHPYASLVAFAATEDLSRLVFVTTRATQKFMNLMAQPHAALLIDSRTNRVADFHDAIAVTATGVAVEAVDAEREALARLFLVKHGYMASFVRAPTTALFCVTVDRYRLVERFQHVVDLDGQQWVTS